MKTRHGSLLAAALMIALAACSSASATSPPSSQAATTSREPSLTSQPQDMMGIEDFAPLDPGTYFITPTSTPPPPFA
jgi:uncharacterized lipoprotein